jgi:S-adenosyl-L-methionine hydrolase (adenosine-forming)
MAIITLTTDFGMRDGYVGAVKGVLARNTSATLIDIAHDIPRGDIAHGAWVVATSSREFPHGTIHVVVVDPNVGGARKPVIVKASGQWYVGPDNGVFAYVADQHNDAWVIEARHFRARRVSPTFHGRDVFAHAAAALARGEDVLMAGPPTRLAGALPWGVRETNHGRIVHVDHYGNLISDLPAAEAGGAVAIAGRTLPLVTTYDDVASGQLLAYVGSAGTVEIAVRDGRADNLLEAPRGTAVVPAATSVPYR